MNPQCDECLAQADCLVLRDSDGNWLALGSDCFYHTPDGQRLRMAELPEAFESSLLVKVKLAIVLCKETPRCLCQHCGSKEGRRRAVMAKAVQTDFFSLLEVKGD